MELDSVRGLKAEISREIVAQAEAETAVSYAAFASAEMSRIAEESNARHGTIALGVANASNERHNEYRLAVRLTDESAPLMRRAEDIRAAAKGEADIRVIGRVIKQQPPWHRQRNRPLMIGGSIAHHAITAGTLGCFVKEVGRDVPLILSNNHVLANENKGAQGDTICQPGPADNGQSPGDKVAELSNFIPLDLRGTNLVDCAVATLHDGMVFDHVTLTGLGTLAGLGPAIDQVEVNVSKIGRTTGLRHGIVTAFEMDYLYVDYDLGALRFDNQIEIEGVGADAFSEGGDSGSLVVDNDNRAVAMLFAGSSKGGQNGKGLSYAHPLAQVLDVLNVELL